MGRVHPLPTDLDLGPAVGSEDTEDASTRIYLAMLRHPAPSRAALVAEGIDGSLIDDIVPLLAARRLIDVHPDGEWTVHPPDVAMPALAADYERRARSTRAAAREMAELYFAARATPQQAGPDDVQVLSSLHDIGAASSEIVGKVKERVLAMRTVSPRTLQVLQSPPHSHEQPTRSPDDQEVQTRAVYDVSVLETAGALRVLQARIRDGEDSRLATGVPFSCLVVDDKAAVVDVSHVDRSGRGSLLVRNAALVSVLTDMVERCWERATPTPKQGETNAASVATILNRRDKAILTLLAAGAADATIARQCGISQRTVERRVRSLMNSLGAGTRFQAGVQAARHGLI